MTDPSALTDYRDRIYVSQYSAPTLPALQIHIGGTLADPDGQTVAATVVAEGTGEQVSTGPATRSGAGVYEAVLTSAQTGVPGNYTLVFTYAIGGVHHNAAEYLEVGLANPAYDMLPDAIKDIIEGVWLRFLDCFDSPSGGVNAGTYIQSRWSRGRVAQLMKTAVGRINTMQQPWQNYTLDGIGGPQFPIQYWAPLLDTATYVEVLRHLCRDYVEQPELSTGANITRLERQQYLERWTGILEEEKPVLKAQMDTFKISNMGLGKPRVLISGGVFGRYSPTRIAGSAAARPRYFARFY